jgi:hypothetical protein
MNKRPSPWIFAVILFGFTVLILPAQASGSGAPRLKFKETSWDFGKIKQGEIVSHEFVFTNEGDDTLKIERVASSCGCTAVLVSDQEIPARKQGKVEVKFNSQGYGGNITKVIYVFSNDPNEAQKPLEIKADVETPPSPRIEIDPYNYDAGLLIEGEDVVANVKIKNKGELELRVEFNHRNATYSVNGKPAPVPLKIPAGKEVDVAIRIPAPGPLGSPASGSAPATRTGAVREYVLIKSNDNLRSTVALYISGYIISKDQLKDLFQRYKDILR